MAFVAHLLFRNNIAKLRVYFRQLNYERIETRPAYDVSLLCSSSPFACFLNLVETGEKFMHFGHFLPQVVVVSIPFSSRVYETKNHVSFDNRGWNKGYQTKHTF